MKNAYKKTRHKERSDEYIIESILNMYGKTFLENSHLEIGQYSKNKLQKFMGTAVATILEETMLFGRLFVKYFPQMDRGENWQKEKAYKDMIIWAEKNKRTPLRIYFESFSKK